MYKYSISFALFLFFSAMAFSQQNTKSADTLAKKQKYGLRIGLDLSRPARSFLDENYEAGFEFVADYRVNKRFYIAAEVGSEENIEDEEFFNFTSNGTYIKAGFDYRTGRITSKNQSYVHIGLRYGISNFSQTVNSFTINNRNQFFGEAAIPGNEEDILREFDGLSLQWVEANVGLKVEIFTNLFLSATLRFNVLTSETESDIFPNLWSPGFTRISDNSNISVSYNYAISYLIPVFQKR